MIEFTFPLKEGGREDLPFIMDIYKPHAWLDFLVEYMCSALESHEY